MNLRQLSGGIVKRGLVAPFFLVVMLAMLTACTQSGSDASKDDEATAGGDKSFSNLTYTNSGAPFDYQKKMLADGNAVRQYEYALFEAGSIPVDDAGNVSFSATGPGYELESTSSESTSTTVEEPMKVEIKGKIDREVLGKALTEKDGATVIGTATYKHRVDGSKKYTFSGGDYESAEYSQVVEKELDILYIANRDIIVFSSNGSFVVENVGTAVTSYSGSKDTDTYEQEDSMNLYLEFAFE